MTSSRRATMLRAVVVGLAAVGTMLMVTAARAEQVAAVQGSGASCVVQGRAWIGKDTEIFNAATGGHSIAKFSGALAPMKVTKFPADPAKGRALVNLGNGFRVEGFVDPRAMTVYGVRDLSVAGGHLWISSGTPLRIVGASPGRIRLKLPAGAGLAQPLYSWVSCDQVTFTRGHKPVYEVEGHARGYVARHGALDLYDEPGGSVVKTLYISGEGSGLLMWGRKFRRGYVHVTSRSNIFIDAWVKYRDVRALPRGEMMDQVAAPDTYRSPAKLALKEYLKVMKAPRNIPLHFGRGKATNVIGMLEKDADIYVLETVVGWATVLPKRLHVLPVGDRAFWVEASKLGLTSPKPPSTGPSTSAAPTPHPAPKAIGDHTK